MASNPSTEKFKCTFKLCFAAFDTVALLRKHKINTPDHDYCAICDLDFEDDGALLVHKIESNRHITCPVCSADFKSEGGQRFHIEQMHAAKQNIKCVGCGEMFKRAGSLMSHIEQNTCPKITVEHFQEQRAQKNIVKAFLADPENFQFPPGVDSEAIMRSFGGKMGLAEPSLIDYDIHSALGGRVLGPAAKSANVDLLNDRLLPEEDLVGGLKDMDLDKSNKEEIKDEPVTTTRETSKSPPKSAAASVGPKQTTSPDEETKSKTEEEEEGQRYIENTNPWDPNSKCFRPSSFLHPVTGKYVCPHPGCRTSIKTLQGFKQHLTSAAHLADRIICPCCLKNFKSHTALIQHCESPSSRCQIRRAFDYNDALGTMTGGLIEVKGVHPDGTVKYEAANVEW